MQASRRAIQIVKLEERRQKLATKARDADRLLAGEKLGKPKATSLIDAMLDRVNARSTPDER